MSQNSQFSISPVHSLHSEIYIVRTMKLSEGKGNGGMREIESKSVSLA